MPAAGNIVFLIGGVLLGRSVYDRLHECLGAYIPTVSPGAFSRIVEVGIDVGMMGEMVMGGKWVVFVVVMVKVVIVVVTVVGCYGGCRGV